MRKDAGRWICVVARLQLQLRGDKIGSKTNREEQEVHKVTRPLSKGHAGHVFDISR